MTESGPLGWRANWHRDDGGERWWRSWIARAAVLLLGVLVLGIAFIASYVGALHDPEPKNLPVAVARDDAPARALLDRIRGESETLKTVVYDTPADAADALARRKVYAVLATTETAPTPAMSLLLASAASLPASQVVTDAITAGTDTAEVPLSVDDAYPVSAADTGGLTPFYVVVGWIIAGVFAAVALAWALGSAPRDVERAALRTGALAVFSLGAGAAGAILVGPVFGILEHAVGLTVAGTLITFASAMITAACQGWLGMIGIGLAIVLLVVLGNPGSGAIYPPEMLPGAYRSMIRWTPTGLGADLVEGVAYFGRKATGWPITGLALWALVGLLALLGATRVMGRRVPGS